MGSSGDGVRGRVRVASTGFSLKWSKKNTHPYTKTLTHTHIHMHSESQKHLSVIKVQLCLSFQHTWKTHQGQRERERERESTREKERTQPAEYGCHNTYKTSTALCHSHKYTLFILESIQTQI